ncbi:MAG: phosphatidate cytidylyltransferase [Firmicutes bacterium]|nr:phosphatidate cytidylyltransferase [Bacillota bacterium]
MLRERVISAVVGVPIIVLFLLLGKYFFTFLILVIVAVGLDELYSIFVLRDLKPNIVVGMLGAIALVIAALVGAKSGLVAVLSAIVIAVLIWQIFTQGSIINTGLTLAGILYVAFTLSHMVLQYNLSFGRIGVLMVFIGTWLSDIAAYFVGSAIGKRKIAPSISANKTLEGLVAGLITPAVVLAILFTLPWLPFAAEQGIFIAILKGFGMGLIIGIFAPFGDLVESRIKREMRVKDSGAIIPGHGGVLDRFDSVLFTSVAGYYFWLLVK